MRAFDLRHIGPGACVLLAAGRLAAAPLQDGGGSNRDEIHLAEADRSSRHGRFSDAIAETSAVIASNPGFGQAYFVRALLYIDAGRFDDADRDIDTVQAMHPDYAGAHFERAEIDLFRHRPAAALTELGEAAKLPATTIWKRSRRYDTMHTQSYWYALNSMAEQMQGHDDAAIEALADELKFETERPWYVLGYHCYIAAVAGLLDMAELTCDEAIDKQGHDTGTTDSRGFVHLKMRKWAAAIADYDKALIDRPDLTLSLYGRGIARRALGDRVGGDADIQAARRAEPDVANIMARLGVPAT